MDAQTVAKAIATAEGFFVQGAIPQLANNPGDLRLGDVGHGMLGEGITVFGNVEAGWAALHTQVQRMLTGRSLYYKPQMTIAEVGLKYSGGDPNWGKNVAATLKVPESMTLAELAAFSQ